MTDPRDYIDSDKQTAKERVFAVLDKEGATLTQRSLASAAAVSLASANKYLELWRAERASGARPNGDPEPGRHETTFDDVTDDGVSAPHKPPAGSEVGKQAVAFAEALQAASAATVSREDVEKIVAETLDKHARGADDVRKLIADEIDKAKLSPVVKKVTVKVDKGKPIKVGLDKHPQLAAALRLVKAGMNNLWLCGPAGGGKTTLGKQLAEELDRPFGTINCTAGMSEVHLLGRMNPLSGEYWPAAFVKLYEGGGVFLADEFDAADPNVVLALNTATSNGQCPLPNRHENPLAERHPENILIVATNTWGNGADAQYSGRDVIDAAVRDRYALAKLFVGYSHQLEVELFGAFERQASGKGWDEWVAPAKLAELEWPGVFEQIRANIGAHNLRRTLSTRAKAQAHQLAQAGYDTRELVSMLFQDWTEQERLRGLEGL